MVHTRFASLARGALVPAVVLSLLALSLPQATAQAAPVNCTVGADAIQPDQEEQNLLNLVNRYRAQPYQWSNTLSQAAVWLAHDMADHNYLGDVDSLGRGVRARLTDCGYGAALPVGEDVAAGTGYLYGDSAVLSNWMFDPAKWDLVVSPTYTVAGIARAYGPYSTQKNYWVLVVGTTGSAALPPNPTATPTSAPPTATSVPPTATPTRVPPTATRVPPTATSVPPTATPTRIPPTATPTRVPPTAAATASCAVNAAELPPDAEEQRLLNTINAYRASKYAWDNTLSQAAVWLAHDMADHNYLGDVDSLGRGVRARLTDCGYGAALPVGEDVAAGVTYLYGDSAVLSNWMFDPAKWDLVVSPTYTVAGIARAYGPYSTQKNYWVLVVGTR